MASCLMRLSAGGGHIFTARSGADRTSSQSALLDKVILLSENTPVKASAAEEQADRSAAAERFRLLSRDAEPVVHRSGIPWIAFQASPEWVKQGDSVYLQWLAQPARTVTLYPGGLVFPPEGSHTCTLEEDTLFSLQAHNGKDTAERRLFVKVFSQRGVDFQLETSPGGQGPFITLTAHPSIPGHFALPPDSPVRISWEAERMGVLSERNWGEIPLCGHRLVEFREDTTLLFTWKTMFEEQQTTLHFYILTEEKKEKEKSWFGFFRKRP